MSNPKRLHPIMILFSIIVNIKDIIIPAFIYFFIFVFRDPPTNKWLSASPYLFIIIAMTFIIASSVIKWFRYTYRMENNELRIEYGLFVKKKRYIPFERIQGLDYSESILHRPFKLVKVKVETAASSLDESEAELTAIKLEEANAIKRMIARAKSEEHTGEAVQIEQSESSENRTVIYRMTNKQLLFFASTSGRAGVIISAVLAFVAQFDELIPYKKIFNELEDIVRTGVLLISIIIVLALFLAWLLSVAWAYLKYNDFTLKVINEDLVITRGLLEKRTTTIPIRKIQAVRMTESLFRQPFGYASVSVEYAGGSILEENMEGLILPVVKKEDVDRILRPTLSDYQFNVEFIGAPLAAKRRYCFMKLIFSAMLTVGLSIWFWPHGLLAGLLLGVAWYWGILQYHSAGWNISNQQLSLRYRGIQQVTVWMKRNRMQSLSVSVSWLQRRARLASVDTAVMSSGTSTSAVEHLSHEDALQIYHWYQPTSE